MRSLLAHVLVFSLVFGFPGALSASSYKWIGQGGDKKWQSHAEFSGHAATNSLYGLELSPFVTIAQDDVSLWFLNVRNNMFWEHSDFGHEFNVGGGYRRLMGDSSWIFGGYGFFDRLESRWDNHFNQGTIGMEALWVDWDLRANGYIADDDEKFASEAAAAKAKFSGGTVVVESGIEQAMSGFDAEVGWRLPFDQDSWLGDTRVYAGGFWFDGDLVSSIAGPKLRAEMRVHDIPGLWEGSRLTVSATYRWDDERNSDFGGMIGVRIPIGAPKRTQPLTYLERRMTDSVVRDSFVVTGGGLGKTEGARTSTGVIIGDGVFFDSEGDGDITDIENPGSVTDAIACGVNCLLIGLNLTGDVEVENKPLMDGQTVAGGGSELVVFGASSGQGAKVRLPGERSAVIVNDDTTAFLLAENNTIAGLTFNNFGDDMNLALELELSGQSTTAAFYQNTFRSVTTALAVDVEDDSSLQLWMTENFFSDVETGLDLRASDSFDVQLEVHGNTFIQSPFGPFGDAGLDLALVPDSIDHPSFFTLNASGNTFGEQDGDDQESGIITSVWISGDQDYTHTTRIWDNVFNDLDFDDYELNVYGASPGGDVAIDVELRDNISEDGDTFADIEIDPIPYGSIDISIVGNDIEDTNSTPIEIGIYDAPDVNITITDNSIVDTTYGDAIDIYLYNAGDDRGNTIDVSRNEIFDVEAYYDPYDYQNPYSHAIQIDVNDSYDTTITVNDNDIQNADGGGAIAVHMYSTGHNRGNDLTINGNRIDEVDGFYGIAVGIANGFDSRLTIADNDISDIRGYQGDYGNYGYYIYGGTGIDAFFYENGHEDGDVVTIENNRISGTYFDGIFAGFIYGYDGSLTIANNEISNIQGYRAYANQGYDTSYALYGGHGIDVYFYENGHSSPNATIENNTISDTGGDGIEVGFFYNNDSTLTIANNTISDAERDGIDVYFVGNGSSSGDTVTIDTNTISNVERDGIDVYFGLGFDAALAIQNNTISDADDDGIEVDFYLNGHDVGNTATVASNTISNSGDDGINVGSSYSYDIAVGITDNNIYDADGGDGIEVDIYRNGQDGGVGSSVTVSGNTVDSVDDDAIEIDFYQSLDGTVMIENNTITDAGDIGSGDGIDVYFYDNGHDVGNVATIRNNNIDHVVGGDGIDVGFRYGYDAVLTISNNTINNVDYEGIEVDFYDNGHAIGNTVSINGNTITNVENDGIDVDIDRGYGSALTISGNRIDGTREDGIDVYLYNIGYASETASSVTIENNTINDVADDGIDLYRYASSYADEITISNNRITASGDNGIEVGSNDADDATFTIQGNNVSDSGGDGIHLDVDDSDDNVFTLIGNNIDETGDGIGDDHGIAAYFHEDADGNTLEVRGNLVDNSDDYGIYAYTYEDDTTELDSDGSNNTVLNSGDGEDDEGTGFVGSFIGTIRVNGVDVP